jgi:hypothetical protein
MAVLAIRTKLFGYWLCWQHAMHDWRSAPVMAIAVVLC